MWQRASVAATLASLASVASAAWANDHNPAGIDWQPIASGTGQPFSMARTETTVGQFQRFAQATGLTTLAERQGGGQVYEAGWVQKPGWHWRAPFGAKPATAPKGTSTGKQVAAADEPAAPTRSPTVTAPPVRSAWTTAAQRPATAPSTTGHSCFAAMAMHARAPDARRPPAKQARRHLGCIHWLSLRQTTAVIWPDPTPVT